MKRFVCAFFLGMLIAAGLTGLPKLKAETKLYISEDILTQILSTLEEIKSNQANMQNRQELKEIKQLNIKLDQILYTQQQILKELHKIKVRI
ncbi:MAG TPA: hypothetical protein ENG39_00280 [Candidatus Omnitrophica bacterium]|nr:hypothetical protein [Candidatus Omnitrophota bacterium]